MTIARAALPLGLPLLVLVGACPDDPYQTQVQPLDARRAMDDGGDTDRPDGNRDAATGGDAGSPDSYTSDALQPDHPWPDRVAEDRWCSFPNLLDNPDFENGTEGWFLNAGPTATFTVATPGHTGDHAAEIIFSAAAENSEQIYQNDIALESNTEYRLSFFARSSSGNNLHVSIVDHDAPETGYGIDGVFDMATEWRPFTDTFSSGYFDGVVDNARLRFRFAPYAASGEVYHIDTVVLEKVCF